MYKDYKPTKTIFKVIFFHNDSLMLKFVKMTRLDKWIKVEEKKIGMRKWKVKSMIKKIKP